VMEPVMGRGVVNIQDLIDDANCYRKVRELRWPEGVRCPFCGDEHRLKHGFGSTQKNTKWMTECSFDEIPIFMVRLVADKRHQCPCLIGDIRGRNGYRVGKPLRVHGKMSSIG